jgi:TRAP-type mannitol/chloroaromatic compound transport system permease small subunit
MPVTLLLQGIAEILKSVLVIRGTADGSLYDRAEGSLDQAADGSDKETKELIL